MEQIVQEDYCETTYRDLASVIDSMRHEYERYELARCMTYRVTTEVIVCVLWGHERWTRGGKDNIAF